MAHNRETGGQAQKTCKDRTVWVMYHFATIEELKKAAFQKTDEYHTEYLMNIPETQEDVLLGIGLNYIRFAVEEPNLFRFLGIFDSDSFV